MRFLWTETRHGKNIGGGGGERRWRFPRTLRTSTASSRQETIDSCLRFMRINRPPLIFPRRYTFPFTFTCGRPLKTCLRDMMIRPGLHPYCLPCSWCGYTVYIFHPTPKSRSEACIIRVVHFHSLRRRGPWPSHLAMVFVDTREAPPFQGMSHDLPRAKQCEGPFPEVRDGERRLLSTLDSLPILCFHTSLRYAPLSVPRC